MDFWKGAAIGGWAFGLLALWQGSRCRKQLADSRDYTTLLEQRLQSGALPGGGPSTSPPQQISTTALQDDGITRRRRRAAHRTY